MQKSIRSTDYRILCEMLKQRREHLGLSQDDLAERLDKPQSFVWKYENRERRLDMAETRHIVIELGMNFPHFAEQYEAAVARGGVDGGG